MTQTAPTLGKARTIKETFSRETTVGIDIQADSAIIWALLTNAADFSRWNTTVISLEGNIQKGERIKLKSSLNPKRIFTLTIKEFEPEKRLLWGDSQGNRTFILSPVSNGNVRFSMTEKIGGLMFPLYAKYIPPFDASFEQFAAELKKESEFVNNTRK